VLDQRARRVLDGESVRRTSFPERAAQLVFGESFADSSGCAWAASLRRRFRRIHL